jgi:serine phosphatase RsbU (regulator of sigma subunit)
MPVGMVPGVPFSVEKLQLASGDRLVLCTDGITEAENERGDFFGKTRLRNAVQSADAVGCRAMHDAIQEKIREFTGGAEQSDDVTLVVIEYAGLPG